MNSAGVSEIVREMPSLSQALRYWLKLGCISFGGPAGQIALMHQELVERKGWISEERFNHALRFCMTLPGPEAQQLATYIGWTLHGVRGGLAAGILFILPSFGVLLGISWVYAAFGHTTWLTQTFYGVKPAVLALVVFAAWRMGRRTLKGPLSMGLTLASFVAVTVWHIPFPLVLIAAALVGFASQFTSASRKRSETKSTVTPEIPFDKPQWHNTAFIWLHGLWLWALPFFVLVFWGGWQHTLTQMAWFFTKAAWLTFGGAYAVLPYVFQAGVHHYGWLTSTQMMDGLALGESTPGPLIMVVTFVAFLGGYGEPDILGNLGMTWPFWAGAAAMTLATWFTFLPSFLFILSGAPWIDALRHQNRLQAPMMAMTAAIVGVIAQLGFQLAMLILWPNGEGHKSGLMDDIHFGWAGLDGMALALSLLSLVGLMRFRIPVLALIGISALLGLVWQHFLN